MRLFRRSKRRNALPIPSTIWKQRNAYSCTLYIELRTVYNTRISNSIIPPPLKGCGKNWTTTCVTMTPTLQTRACWRSLPTTWMICSSTSSKSSSLLFHTNTIHAKNYDLGASAFFPLPFKNPFFFPSNPGRFLFSFFSLFFYSSLHHHSPTRSAYFRFFHSSWLFFFFASCLLIVYL